MNASSVTIASALAASLSTVCAAASTVQLGTGANEWSYARAVNIHGDAVGFVGPSVSSFQVAATLWSNNSPQTPFQIGPLHSDAFDISDSGVIVGEGYDEFSDLRPFSWFDGVVSYLEGEGSARSVNEVGTVAGTAELGGPERQPAIWRNGTRTLLDTLGHQGGVAYAINDSDVAAGYLHTNGVTEGFRWENGVTTPLGDLGGDGTLVFGINESGLIVGGSRNETGHYEAFIWNGQINGIGNFGFEQSALFAINDHDVAVGFVWNELGPIQGFVYHQGQMTLLADLLPAGHGWTSLKPYDINNNGVIVGEGRINGQIRGFVMTIPGPAGLPLLVATMMVQRSRRRS